MSSASRKTPRVRESCSFCLKKGYDYEKIYFNETERKKKMRALGATPNSSPAPHFGYSSDAALPFSSMLLYLTVSFGAVEQEASSLGALMEFLRLLCENHYTEMQDYMRTQPDNMRSYNVVSESER